MTLEDTRDQVIAWASARASDRGPKTRAGTRRAVRTSHTVGVIVASRSQPALGSGARTKDEHRITPRTRPGSRSASMRARGPENDHPSTQNSEAPAALRSTSGSRSAYPLAPEVGYVTTRGVIQLGSAATRGSNNTSVPSIP